MRESATSALPQIGHFLLRFIAPCYESFPHREMPWETRVMLTNLGEYWHLSMDPLDRLPIDVYDCVTDEALGAGARWGTRELGLLRQQGPAR